MSTMTEMMGAMPAADMMPGMDVSMMEQCMEACSAAMEAATMCADACGGMEGMGRCAAMCADTADVAMATMRMMMRPMGYDTDAMAAMMHACMTMGAACAAECSSHADVHDHCRICEQACVAMVDACRAMTTAMSA